jgi:hypothetical protein
MIGCKTCKHNKKRTIRSKNCLKNHRAVFGYNCKDYEKGDEGIGSLRVNNFDGGLQK